MADKSSKWRRSFRSKRTNQKQRKDTAPIDCNEASNDEAIGDCAVDQLEPAAGAGGSQLQEGKARQKKSSALGAMKRLFSKLGKGRQRGKDASQDRGKDSRPHVQDELIKVPTAATPDAVRLQERNTEMRQSGQDTRPKTSQIPLPIQGGSQGSPRAAAEEAEGNIRNGRSTSLNRANIPVQPTRINPAPRPFTQSGGSPRLYRNHHRGGHSYPDSVDKSQRGVDPERGPLQIPGCKGTPWRPRSLEEREGSRTPRQVMKDPSLPEEKQGCTRATAVPPRTNRQEATNNGITTRSPTKDPKETRLLKSQQLLTTDSRGKGGHLFVTSHAYPDEDSGRNLDATKPPGSDFPLQKPVSTCQPEVETEIAFIDDDVTESTEKQVNIPHKREDKPLKGVEKIASKFRDDLPPAFLTLLEAPLPARPWHPEAGPSRRVSPPPPPPPQRPLSQPTQLYRKSSSQVPPASVIHYHVTIQNTDGLEVNVEPLDKSDKHGSQGISTKTVYTADGRQLKRLSWVEVSPLPLTDEADDFETPPTGENALPSRTNSVIEIGSMSLGIDSKKAGSPAMENEVYLSEEAEKLFEGQSEVIVAAPVVIAEQTTFKPVTPDLAGNRAGLGSSRESLRDGYKAEFPWHSKRSGSLASLGDDGKIEDKKQEKDVCDTHVTQDQCGSTSPSRQKRKQAKTSSLPRPTFKPGERNASNKGDSNTSETSPKTEKGAFGQSVDKQTTRKRDRRRRPKTGEQNTENPPPCEPSGSREIPGRASAFRDAAHQGAPDQIQPTVSRIPANPNIDISHVRPASDRQVIRVPSSAPKNRACAESVETPLRPPTDDDRNLLCAECRDLRSRLSAGSCAHRIPHDIVARRKADFEQLAATGQSQDRGQTGSDVTADDDVTAMRVGPKTTFFKNAQCQTNTPESTDSVSGTKVEDASSRGRSRPVGRVAPNVRRSASAHGPTTSRERTEPRVGRLQRHWSFSSVDTDIHTTLTNHLSSLSVSSSSSSPVEWESASIDTDLLTLETDRTLLETERTLREVEISIQESRNASRALRRARQNLDADVTTPRAQSRGVSVDRGMSDRDARRRQLRLESEARVAAISARIQSQNVFHSLGTPTSTMTDYLMNSQRMETTCDKLTRIRENLIRVPGVLILGLRGGKIAVTMSPDRPHFEPIYRFMRENNVYMTEYECAVLANRYRSPRLGSSTFTHQPLTSPVLVR